MATVLAVDYGKKRIGLAIGDTDTGVATPLPPVAGTGVANKDAQVVAASAVEYAATQLVVGLPLNMDGTEGKQAAVTRAFGTRLAKTAGIPVAYNDERLTSRGADELLRQRELSNAKRKKRRDSLAAMIILQSYLDATRPGPIGDG